jgi:hypothetical protein
LRLLLLTVQYSFFPSRFNSKQLEQTIHTRGWIA